jgi:hypothetical protein
LKELLIDKQLLLGGYLITSFHGFL